MVKDRKFNRGNSTSRYKEILRGQEKERPLAPKVRKRLMKCKPDNRHKVRFL